MERAKREGTKKGEQYVGSTEAARETRKEASARDQPIDGYDATNVEKVKDQLDALSERKLKKVEAYKEAHKSCKALLEQLDRKIGDDS